MTMAVRVSGLLHVAMALVFGAAAALAGAQPVVRIATEGAYAPWNYKDAQGKLVGWDIEIANALCAQMGVKCEIVAQDWDGIIPGLLAKKYDAIIAGMSMTPARRERVGFTSKYKDVVSVFVAKKGTITDTSPAGMKGKRIGVQRGAAQKAWLDAAGYDKTAELVLYDSTRAVELDLLAGRLDAMIGNKATYFVDFMKKQEAAGFEFVGPDLKGGPLGEGAGIAVRKEDTELAARFNRAIAAIRADGSYDRISAAYFPFRLLAD
jgi:lysine-arginine-ornithine-binding protein